MSLSSGNYNTKKNDVSLTNAALIRTYDLQKTDTEDENLSEIPDLYSENLNEYKKAVISYVAGFAGKMAQKRKNCETCADAIGSIKGLPESSFFKIQRQRWFIQTH